MWKRECVGCPIKVPMSNNHPPASSRCISHEKEAPHLGPVEWCIMAAEGPPTGPRLNLRAQVRYGSKLLRLRRLEQGESTSILDKLVVEVTGVQAMQMEDSLGNGGPSRILDGHGKGSS